MPQERSRRQEDRGRSENRRREPFVSQRDDGKTKVYAFVEQDVRERLFQLAKKRDQNLGQYIAGVLIRHTEDFMDED